MISKSQCSDQFHFSAKLLSPYQLSLCLEKKKKVNNDKQETDWIFKKQNLFLTSFVLITLRKGVTSLFSCFRKNQR